MVQNKMNNTVSGGSGQFDGVRASLQRLADGYSDGLRAETRRRVLQAGMDAAVGSRPAFGFPQLIAAAAVLAILALPALFIGRETGPAATSPVRDLQVSQQGGDVVLTWKDGQAPRRVVRATSLQEVARAASLPGEVVRGEKYVDSRSDGAQIVYYIVE
jgi:hypothetical protein